MLWRFSVDPAFRKWGNLIRTMYAKMLLCAQNDWAHNHHRIKNLSRNVCVQSKGYAPLSARLQNDFARIMTGFGRFSHGNHPSESQSVGRRCINRNHCYIGQWDTCATKLSASERCRWVTSERTNVRDCNYYAEIGTKRPQLLFFFFLLFTQYVLEYAVAYRTLCTCVLYICGIVGSDPGTQLVGDSRTFSRTNVICIVIVSKWVVRTCAPLSPSLSLHLSMSLCCCLYLYA